MGRKRKDASVATPNASRKRHRPEHASGDWALLRTNIVKLIIDRLLGGGDITDHVRFRAVCSCWRACTEPVDLRADSWIALCDGDVVWPEDAREIVMFHTRTARRLSVCLPKLRGYRIIGFSTGLLVLLHKSSAKIRVMDPFTRAIVDFPSLELVYSEAIRDKSSFRAMRAAVCSAASSSSSIAVVIWFTYTAPVVVAAEAGSDRWDFLHRELVIRSPLVFQGRLYTTMKYSFEIVQLYPPPPTCHPRPVVAHVPNSVGCGSTNTYLVESDGTMLLLFHNYVDHENAGADSVPEWWEQLGFRIYAADPNNDGGGGWKFTRAVRQ